MVNQKQILITLTTFIFILFSGIFVESNAQIAIAVAQDEDRSALHWHVTWNAGSSWQTESEAKKALRDNGYTNVVGQPGGESRGHHLDSGYWVVVEGSREVSNGKIRTAFGLGASSHSYSEAEDRAVSNLSQYFWSWQYNDGYRISRQGQF